METNLDEAVWQPHDRALLERSLELSAAATLAETGRAEAVEFGVMFGTDEQIAALNRDWRGKPTPTNVLSWPAEQLRPGAPPPPYWGDLAFAQGVVEREALERHETVERYLCVLTVHGLLHCLGYDHQTDDEAEQMERLEARVLAHLGLPDPYAGTEPL